MRIQLNLLFGLAFFILLSACSSQHQVFKSNSVYSKRTFSKNIRHKSFQHTDIAEKNSTDLDIVNAAISGPIQKGEALINPIELKPETTIPLEKLYPKFYSFSPIKDSSTRDNDICDQHDKFNNKLKDKEIQDSDEPKVEGFGLAGFLFAITSLVLLPYLGVTFLLVALFGLLAFIFGLTSLNRIKNNPEKYKGKGFAIAAVIIGGLLFVLGVLIVIVALLTFGPITIGI
jgi:hypothetical protein